MRQAGVVATVVYVSQYAASVLYLNGLCTYPLEEALTILVVLGLGFSCGHGPTP